MYHSWAGHPSHVVLYIESPVHVCIFNLLKYDIVASAKP